MFRQRLLTTLVLVPLVLAAIFYANYWVFSTVLLVMMLGCGWEWLQLIPIKRPVSKSVFLLVLLLGSYIIQLKLSILPQPIFVYWLFAGLFLWLIIFILVTQFPTSKKMWAYPWAVGFFCLILLPLFAKSVMAIFLMEKGKILIVYLLFLVWGADIGAYLAGKQWGRHKLIPAVSPGKTVEGVFGGFLLAMVVAFIGYYSLQPTNPLRWFTLAVAVTLISLLGDLFISMLKRRSSIKDTGQLLPGHGGILDRLDSLIAAAPLFYYGFYFWAPGL